MRYLTIILLFISSLAMAQRPYLFPTIADAASNTYIGIGAYVQTQGYSASGDGGGALYRMTAIASAPMAADSGYVYPVTAGKVLVQVLEDEYLRTATYGVVCGSSAEATNNYNRLQRFFTAINTLDKQAFVNGCNDTIYVNFTSALTTTLTSHDKFVMRGEGADVTRIKATAGSIDFGFSDAAKVNLFDLYLHGYDATAFGGIGGADQSLTYVNDTLTISGGNFVVITGGGGGGTDDQTISIDSNAFKYTLSIESGNSVTFAKVTDTDTDDQTLSFSSPNLSISEGNTVDLSALQDGTGTDDQTLTLDSVSGTYNLTIESGNTVKIKRDTDTDDQTLSVDSTAYKYTITIADGNAIDFGKSQDNSVSNELQTIALDSVSGTYNLTLSNGGGTVKIKRDTDTDDQTLSLVTNTLSISEGNSVDLAAYLDNTDDQVISIDSNATTYTLTLESGGSIKILKSVNTDAQTLSFSNPNLSISGGNSVDISGIDTDTDDQTLSIDSNATTYTLTIVDGNNVKFAKGGGGGTPGGSNTNIQFNDGGSFAGEDSLRWIKGTNTLGIIGGQIELNDVKFNADSALQNIYIRNDEVDISARPDGSIAIGHLAGGAAAGQSLNRSVWLGTNAGGALTGTGQLQQVSIGYNAGNNANQHSVNVGYNAGSVSGIGSVNIGYQAGDASTGTMNTNIGFNAGGATGTWAYNVNIGAYSGSNSRGTYLTNIGWNAGTYQDGNYTISIGQDAGLRIADATNLDNCNDCIFIGRDTRAAAESESNEVVIGLQAIGNGSNTVTIGNSSITDNYFEGNIHATGGLVTDVTTVAAATYNTTASDHFIHVTYTATGAVTIDLQSAQVIAGKQMIIKDAGGSAGSNNITISTQGSETIDGSATATISSNYGAVRLYCDGTNWFTW